MTCKHNHDDQCSNTGNPTPECSWGLCPELPPEEDGPYHVAPAICFDIGDVRPTSGYASALIEARDASKGGGFWAVWDVRVQLCLAIAWRGDIFEILERGV